MVNRTQGVLTLRSPSSGDRWMGSPQHRLGPQKVRGEVWGGVWYLSPPSGKAVWQVGVAIPPPPDFGQMAHLLEY